MIGCLCYLATSPAPPVLRSRLQTHPCRCDRICMLCSYLPRSSGPPLPLTNTHAHVMGYECYVATSPAFISIYLHTYTAVMGCPLLPRSHCDVYLQHMYVGFSEFLEPSMWLTMALPPIIKNQIMHIIINHT